MNRLPPSKRAQVVAALVEGNSIRSTVRMTGVAKNTVVKLLVELGAACSKYQDEKLRNLTCKRVQCDEVRSYCWAKDKNLPQDKKGQPGFGSVWTWTAIDADTKLIPCWFIGGRDAGSAHEFISDLSARLKNRVQLTTDGHRVYLDAVESNFGNGVDYAMLVKLYGEDRAGGAMRRSMRRFTRLTNAFSKKTENHAAAAALYFMYYNFARIHQTLRVTPAMEAGVSDHVWSIEEIVALLDSN